ncbi:MAG: MAPEG family protein [Pseudomonadota bacterium]
MTNLPVYTAALGAFLIVLQVSLMLTVGLYRSKGVFVGLGEDPTLERMVRRHGNLAENSGLFVAVLALLEILVGQTTLVATLCVVLAIARLLHAIGFSSMAGSHGEDLAGARKLFVAARSSGALGTIGVALGAAWGIVQALISATGIATALA